MRPQLLALVLGLLSSVGSACAWHEPGVSSSLSVGARSLLDEHEWNAGSDFEQARDYAADQVGTLGGDVRAYTVSTRWNPLDGLRKYTGGYEPYSTDYWASLIFLGTTLPSRLHL